MKLGNGILRQMVRTRLRMIPRCKVLRTISNWPAGITRNIANMTSDECIDVLLAAKNMYCSPVQEVAVSTGVLNMEVQEFQAMDETNNENLAPNAMDFPDVDEEEDQDEESDDMIMPRRKKFRQL